MRESAFAPSGRRLAHPAAAPPPSRLAQSRSISLRLALRFPPVPHLAAFSCQCPSPFLSCPLTHPVALPSDYYSSAPGETGEGPPAAPMAAAPAEPSAETAPMQVDDS